MVLIGVSNAPRPCRLCKARKMRVGQHVALAFLPLGMIGCRTPVSVHPGQYERGLVWLFPGVEGGAARMRPAIRAFRDVGVDGAIEIHDWDRAMGLVRNLVDHKRNRRDARRIARRIEQYHGEHPNNPVDLIGYSGGGGMAVMVAEALSERIRIRNLVLVQPALSSRYNLSSAIRHVDGSLVHFSSPLDAVVLGMGTTALGTMDRVYGPSSGWLGIDLEYAAPERELRDKVTQITWSPSMVSSGHWGGHAQIFGYAWNRRYVAPHLLPRQSSRPPAKPERNWHVLQLFSVRISHCHSS